MNRSFYFLRHALTDANAQKLLCGGSWDVPLNAEGQAQAAHAAQAYAMALSEVRTICCSPMLRARQTAACFASQLNIPVVTVDALKEQRLGEWEQKPWQDVPEFFSGTKDPPHGESRAQLDKRLQGGLQEAARHAGPVLLVSHGSIWFALHRLLELEPEPPGSCMPFLFQPAGSQETRAWVRSKLKPS